MTNTKTSDKRIFYATKTIEMKNGNSLSYPACDYQVFDIGDLQIYENIEEPKVKMDASCFMSEEERAEYSKLYVSKQAMNEIQAWDKEVVPEVPCMCTGEFIINLQKPIRVTIQTKYLEQNRWDILARALDILENQYKEVSCHSLYSEQIADFSGEITNLKGIVRTPGQKFPADMSKLEDTKEFFVIEISKTHKLTCYFSDYNIDTNGEFVSLLDRVRGLSTNKVVVDEKVENPEVAVDEPVIVNEVDSENSLKSLYSNVIQKINVSVKLDREQLHKLGRKGPYHRYASFPAECSYDSIAVPTSTHQKCKHCGATDSIGGIAGKYDWLCYRCEGDYYLDPISKEVRKKSDGMVFQQGQLQLGCEDFNKPNKCVCSIVQLMQTGCKCGFIEKERNGET